MTFHIIIKGKNKYGKTRAEQESNLRKDGLKGMSEENFDKAQYLEKRHGLKHGFIKSAYLDRV